MSLSREQEARAKEIIEHLHGLGATSHLVELGGLIDEANGDCCGCGWATVFVDAMGYVRPDYEPPPPKPTWPESYKGTLRGFPTGGGGVG